MIDISVIICTHKAPAILFYELSTIASQEFLECIEVVIVNNGFSEEKEKEIRTLLRENFPNFQIVREETPGLGFARRTGFKVAKGNFFLLLDDDNSLDKNFIKSLIEILRKYPSLGGICPLIMPVWEHEPKTWIKNLGLNFLSYNALPTYLPFTGDKYYSPDRAPSMRRPPGGGMIISRYVAESYLERITDPSRIALSRQAKSLIGCEDEEYWEAVKILKLPVFSSDRMIAYHHIPKYRTTFKYLMKLTYFNGYSYGLLDQYRKTDVKFCVLRNLFRQFLNDFVKMVSFLRIKNDFPLNFFLFINQIGRLIGHIKKVSR